MEQRNVFWATIGQFTMRGLVWGALLGGVYGTFMFPIIGTIMGVFYGAIVGYPLGTLNGIIMAALSDALSPVKSRHLIGVICALIGFGGACIGFPLLLNTNQAMIFVIPSVIAGFTSFATVQNIALKNQGGMEKRKNKPKRQPLPESIPPISDFFAK